MGKKNSKTKIKTISFKGRDPVRSTIVINNNTIGKINTVSYLFHTRMKTVLLSKF